MKDNSSYVHLDDPHDNSSSVIHANGFHWTVLAAIFGSIVKPPQLSSFLKIQTVVLQYCRGNVSILQPTNKAAE